MTGKVQFNLNFLPAPLARGLGDVLQVWRQSCGFAEPCPRGLELVTQLYHNISPTSALWPFPAPACAAALAHNTHAGLKLPRSSETGTAWLWKGQAEAHLCPTAVGNEGLAALQALQAQL